MKKSAATFWNGHSGNLVITRGSTDCDGAMPLQVPQLRRVFLIADDKPGQYTVWLALAFMLLIPRSAVCRFSKASFRSFEGITMGISMYTIPSQEESLSRTSQNSLRSLSKSCRVLGNPFLIV